MLLYYTICLLSGPLFMRGLNCPKCLPRYFSLTHLKSCLLLKTMWQFTGKREWFEVRLGGLLSATKAFVESRRNTTFQPAPSSIPFH